MSLQFFLANIIHHCIVGNFQNRLKMVLSNGYYIFINKLIFCRMTDGINMQFSREVLKQITFPNMLTMIRAIMIPVMAKQILVSRGEGLLATILFFSIWGTDVLDGWIARRFNCISDLGKVLDPLVDKIFQITTALCLYLVDKLPIWVFIFLLVKDLAMILASIFMWNRKVVVSAKWHGKLATVLFALAFGTVFLFRKYDFPISHIFLYAAVFMGAVAWIGYLLDFIKNVKAGNLMKNK